MEDIFDGLEFKQELRYGENPHQKAQWYGIKGQGLTDACLLQGKPLSYNNLIDLEAAIATCLLYTSPSPRDGLLSRMPSSA